MSKALEIAKLFIRLAAQEEEPEFLTHLRVQKLLYYAQGWHLAMKGAPLFPEPLKAWKHGPVIREVYDHFRGHGFRAIPKSQGNSTELIPAEAQDFVQSIWAGYRGFSALRLREMTHREAPWMSARKGLKDDARSTAEITKASMREFFVSQYRREAIPGLELEKIRKAEK